VEIRIDIGLDEIEGQRPKMKPTFLIHTHMRYAFVAGDHNIWWRPMIFQSLEMLTLDLMSGS